MIAERPRVQFTYEDYLLIPEDGKRHEIIHGEEYVSPAPKPRHQRIVVNLSGLLFEYLRRTKRGEVYVSPIDVILSETNIVQPDVLFISKDRLSIIEEHAIVGPPDLMVEVLSEGNRRHDEVRKRKLYAQFGVAEYWIVDPVLETIKVYRMAKDDYKRVAEWSRETEDVITTPLLPGLQIPLEDLFS